MSLSTQSRNRGFSLIELVVVVVIIGIIAAIAIPRMSRGAAGASDSSLIADLAQLRNSIDLFYTENNNAFPKVADMPNALIAYSDGTGTVSATKTGNYIYGPYMRAVPPQPVGAARGGTTIAAAAAAGVGWIYTETTGVIKANTTNAEVDVKGVQYNTY